MRRVNGRVFAASTDDLLLSETLSRPLLLLLAPRSDLKVRLIEQVIGLTVIFATFLVPSGWILAHLEDYKHKPSE
uniref:Uncharacterized protein n=1 Tax=Pelusios castaneus TaxID=367368 RepID=A0A8C8S0F5_9SAUR